MNQSNFWKQFTGVLKSLTTMPLKSVNFDHHTPKNKKKNGRARSFPCSAFSFWRSKISVKYINEVFMNYCYLSDEFFKILFLYVNFNVIYNPSTNIYFL